MAALIAQLSRHYRCFAIDTIFDPNKSELAAPLSGNDDVVAWMKDYLGGAGNPKDARGGSVIWWLARVAAGASLSRTSQPCSLDGLRRNDRRAVDGILAATSSAALLRSSV